MSPYGVDKDLGGDSKRNTKWMERCVKRVKSQGKEEGNAIAICKSVMKKAKEKHGDEESTISLAEFILNNILENKKDINNIK